MQQPSRRRPRRTPSNSPIPVVPASSSRRPSIRQARKQAGETNLREEYAYVIKDLRHILILAAVMFILLILSNIVLANIW